MRNEKSLVSQHLFSSSADPSLHPPLHTLPKQQLPPAFLEKKDIAPADLSCDKDQMMLYYLLP